MEKGVIFMKKIFKKLHLIVTKYNHKKFYGFISGHGYLSNSQLKSIKVLVNKDNKDATSIFEKKFSNIIGGGECISYAAARMCFYSLMKVLKIEKGDEIILLGSTCSVMANAVLKIGATPIYSDIDLDTFGSSALSIESCITKSTKMIVAQHSFGIPCSIQKIVSIAQKNDIFLLEDCALTMGSSVNNTVVGNFGDAAIFSTDHTKPLNTIIGGMLYTRHKELADTLRIFRDSCQELSYNKKKSLWIRILVEKQFCNVNKYGKMELVDSLYSIAIKFFSLSTPFLTDDFSSKVINKNYPYPSKLPNFLAQLGIYEVERWEKYKEDRRSLLNSLIMAVDANARVKLPAAYYDELIYIVPLRFVWSDKDGTLKRRELSNLIDVNWTWFLKPIIGTNERLENFGYKTNSCPVSESAGKNMVNIPCNFDKSEYKEFLKKLKLIL
jgi:perosamine synthetase